MKKNFLRALPVTLTGCPSALPPHAASQRPPACSASPEPGTPSLQRQPASARARAPRRAAVGVGSFGSWHASRCARSSTRATARARAPGRQPLGHLGHRVAMTQMTQGLEGVGMAAWGALGHLGHLAIEKKSERRSSMRRCNVQLYAHTVYFTFLTLTKNHDPNDLKAPRAPCFQARARGSFSPPP